MMWTSPTLNTEVNMRWLISLLFIVLTPLVAAAEDQVWYVRCRIWQVIPRVGVLHHACVVICDSKEPPIVNGHGNPRLTYYGSRPSCLGFSPEGNVIEADARRVDIPPGVVRQRLEEYDGRWTLIKNCQTAAHWAVQPPDKRTLWSVMLRR